MARKQKAVVGSATLAGFAVEPYLAAAGGIRKVIQVKKGQVIFFPG
ncbi:MAG TPA: hypothetical protein PKW63_11335 [Vicinamibacterales bacterium]|nr:hypothetical protein [Vicinamibacterales bacterium]